MEIRESLLRSAVSGLQYTGCLPGFGTSTCEMTRAQTERTVQSQVSGGTSTAERARSAVQTTVQLSDVELDALAKVLKKSVSWLLYVDRGEPRR